MRAVASLLLAVLVLGLTACGGDDSENAQATTAEPAETETETTTTSATGCERVTAPAPREDGDSSAPDDELEEGTTYRLTFETNCGSFTVTLDQKTAPNTTRSLVALAEDGFYDNTVFHRIVPDFVIQGGDPTQSGAGGPGYQTVDPPPPSTTYTKGLVAMAKSATEPPGTSGSQFFVVTAPDAQLPPEYAVVGTVTQGLDVVMRIGLLGDATQVPTQTVLIERVTVSESPS
jgi:cyclophilin family peptidyl-prolyl cis-trans isomerase